MPRRPPIRDDLTPEAFLLLDSEDDDGGIQVGPLLRRDIVVITTFLSLAWVSCILGLALPCAVLNHFFPNYSLNQPPALSFGEHVGVILAFCTLPRFAALYERLGRPSVMTRWLRYSHWFLLGAFVLISSYYWQGLSDSTFPLILGFILLCALQTVYALCTADNDHLRGHMIPLILFSLGGLCIFLALPMFLKAYDFSFSRLLLVFAFSFNLFAFPLMARTLIQQRRKKPPVVRF